MKSSVKAYRPFPVHRVEQVHKSPMDYDRRDNERSIKQELKEEDMKDYTRADKIAEDIYQMIIDKGSCAARILTEPDQSPVIEVFGITHEVIKITVDVE